MGKTETENGICVNRVIYSPNERTEIKTREPVSRIHYNRNRGHVRSKVHQCDLSALQRLIIHSLQRGRNKKGARLLGRVFRIIELRLYKFLCFLDARLNPERTATDISDEICCQSLTRGANNHASGQHR